MDTLLIVLLVLFVLGGGVKYTVARLGVLMLAL